MRGKNKELRIKFENGKVYLIDELLNTKEDITEFYARNTGQNNTNNK